MGSRRPARQTWSLTLLLRDGGIPLGLRDFPQAPITSVPAPLDSADDRSFFDPAASKAVERVSFFTVARFALSGRFLIVDRGPNLVPWCCERRLHVRRRAGRVTANPHRKTGRPPCRQNRWGRFSVDLRHSAKPSSIGTGDVCEAARDSGAEGDYCECRRTGRRG